MTLGHNLDTDVYTVELAKKEYQKLMNKGCVSTVKGSRQGYFRFVVSVERIGEPDYAQYAVPQYHETQLDEQKRKDLTSDLINAVVEEEASRDNDLLRNLLMNGGFNGFGLG